MGDFTSRAFTTVLVLFLVFWGATLCALAQAGVYHVYSCRLPSGSAAPVDGWSESVSLAFDQTANTCASGGGLIAALNAGHTHPADTDLATWAFNAPAGETLAGATLWRAGDTAGGGNSNDSYFFWLTGVANSGETTVLFDKCDAFKGCSSEGTFGNPLSATNRAEVPEKALHSPYLSLNASCGSLIAGSECASSPGDEHGYAAVIELFAADLLLTQESAPTANELAGSLAEAATVSGSADLAFHATDSGSGVYTAVFAADGTVVQTTLLSANSGRCHDVGQTSDGLPAFLYVQPCPASLSVDLPFYTSALANGPHHLLVSVTDAAGNSTPVLDRQLTVANPAPGGGGTGPGAGATPTPRGAPNGNPAADAATLTARFRGGSSSPRLLSAYGRLHTLEGRLALPGGQPIAAAALDLSELPVFTGAHATALPAPHTNADGGFSVRLPRNLSSATLRVAYRSHAADTLPVATRTLTLAVPAALQLRISPRVVTAGRTIHFSGRLRGRPIPAGGKQLVLEARSPGTPWIQFHVASSDAHGAFHYAHRFRFPGPIHYSFRVRSNAEADYPYLAGYSNVVGVLER